MRFLVIGDPHFKTNEMVQSIRMAEAIVQIAAEAKPDFIVCLGDTLDRHETIHVEPLTQAIKWLSQLKDIAPVFLLIGNHDRPNNSDFLSDKHPFSGLDQWKNLIVVDKVITRSYGEFNFFFVPYVPPGRFQEALETNPDWSLKKKWTAGFSHQEFYGIEVAKGIFSDKGDRWPVDGPLLINGHIHDRSIPQANIISIGTPRQHDFDESFDKAISLFTFTADAYKEVRIPLPLPRKLIVRLTTQEFYTYELPSPLVDYIKIEISGTRAELVTIRKLDKIKQFRKAGVKIVTRDTEAGLERIREKPLPDKVWQETPFKLRLYHRIKGDQELERVYSRIFQKKRITIKRK